MKKLYSLVLVVLSFTASSFSQNTGYKVPTIFSTSGGGASWANLNGVDSVDNSPAYVDLAQYPTCIPQMCYYSNVASFTGFGFNVPTGATITGIQLRILQRVSSPGGGIHDSTLYLAKSGVAYSLDRAFPANWLDTPTYRLYGGMTDNWGYSWTPADVNDPTFGILYQVTDTSYDQPASVDHLEMNVYYTTGTGIISQTYKPLEISFANNTIYVNGSLKNNIESGLLEVSDITGRTICHEKISSFNSNIAFQKDVSEWNNGIYLVKIISGSHAMMKRVVISR